MSLETIYALSSGAGPTGVAVIRVSGPEVPNITKSLCRKIPEDRVAHLSQLIDPDDNTVLDEALVLYFKGPRSFTGEDVVEFHIHGGRAVISSVLAKLSSFPNCRMAERGEFSRRGFENGKLDLIEVEGLADLIAADTQGQKSQALTQLGGETSKLYENWRADLIYAIALVESALDFSDEADVPEDIAGEALPTVQALQAKIDQYLNDGSRGEIVRDGFRVVIVGPPNAGKSRLLNALAKRDVAIVSDEAGTTRDVIEVRLDIEGLPVIITDTAGIRETESKVELEGIRRSFEQADKAELILFLIDGTDPHFQLTDENFNDQIPVLKVWNKSDLSNVTDEKSDLVDVQISASEGLGLDKLTGLISEAVQERVGQGETVVITRERHRELLRKCCLDLENFIEGDLVDTELRAEDLRQAAFSLGRLVGKVDVEDVLDKIFIEFCIGK